MKEEWRDVPGYEGYYQVSNKGRVKSVERMVPRGNHTYPVQERILMTPPSSLGYPMVNLSKNSSGRTCFVHHLVMSAFVGPCPDGCNVNHIDGDTTHNDFRNLEYVSYKEHDTHTREVLGHDMRGEMHGQSKLTRPQVVEIKRRLAAGERAYLLAREFGVSKSTIGDIKNNRTWSWLD